MTEVISVKFKEGGKAYFFDPAGHQVSVCQKVIVEMQNGKEMGTVSEGNHMVEEEDIVRPLCKMLRFANEKDYKRLEENKAKEADAFKICEEMIENHEVLEFTRYGQNFYGTPKAPIDKWLSEGKTVILKIEVEGASNIKKLYPDSVGIFIMPPSMEVLEQRLRSRGTEGEADIKKRLEIAHSEIGHSMVYDYLVVNDDLEKTSENVLDILHKLYK